MVYRLCCKYPVDRKAQVGVKRMIRKVIRAACGLSLRVGQGIRKTGLGKYFIIRWIADCFYWPADCLNVIDSYRKSFGRPPRLLRPVTFNEKIQTHKLFHRRSIYVLQSDKLAVRPWVAERVGAEVLNDIYWTGPDLEQARLSSLPDRFVIKANHACHTNLIVPNREELNWEEALRLTREWMVRDYSLMWAEWQYRWITPTLLIEKYLAGPDGKSPADYKFFCFDGRVELVEYDSDRFGNHTRAMLDRDFVNMNFGLRVPRHEGPVSKPGCYDQMVEMAEILSKGEPFLRVDFYDMGRPIFSELTLHPTAGVGHFDPMEYDEIVGRLFRL